MSHEIPSSDQTKVFWFQSSAESHFFAQYLGLFSDDVTLLDALNESRSVNLVEEHV